MTRIAVLTAYVSDGTVPEDHLYEIEHDTADYYFFTNNADIKVPAGWNKRLLHPCSADKVFENRRAGKIPKQLAHLLLPDYDYYIWHDYFHFVKEDPVKIVEMLGDADAGLFKHPKGRSWREEMMAAAAREHRQKVDFTLHTLEHFRIPLSSQLWELSCFVRKNNKKTNRCFNLWNELTTMLTSRDQVTFIAAAHLEPIKIFTLPGTALSYGGNNNLVPHKGPCFHSTGRGR